jgi:hypothetical protein
MKRMLKWVHIESLISINSYFLPVQASLLHLIDKVSLLLPKKEKEKNYNTFPRVTLQGATGLL